MFDINLAVTPHRMVNVWPRVLPPTRQRTCDVERTPSSWNSRTASATSMPDAPFRRNTCCRWGLHGSGSPLADATGTADPDLGAGDDHAVPIDQDMGSTLAAVHDCLPRGGWFVFEIRRPEGRDWDRKSAQSPHVARHPPSFTRARQHDHRRSQAGILSRQQLPRVRGSYWINEPVGIIAARASD